MSDKTYDSDDSSFSCDRFLPRVREVAKGLGYAVGVLSGPADLVAVVWENDAGPAERLADAVSLAFIEAVGDYRRCFLPAPARGPQGRLTYQFCCDGRAIVKLSVVPPRLSTDISVLGGRARTKALSPEERSRIARLGAEALWRKRRASAGGS